MENEVKHARRSDGNDGERYIPNKIENVFDTVQDVLNKRKIYESHGKKMKKKTFLEKNHTKYILSLIVLILWPPISIFTGIKYIIHTSKMLDKNDVVEFYFTVGILLVVVFAIEYGIWWAVENIHEKGFDVVYSTVLIFCTATTIYFSVNGGSVGAEEQKIFDEEKLVQDKNFLLNNIEISIDSAKRAMEDRIKFIESDNSYKKVRWANGEAVLILTPEAEKEKDIARRNFESFRNESAISYGKKVKSLDEELSLKVEKRKSKKSIVWIGIIVGQAMYLLSLNFQHRFSLGVSREGVALGVIKNEEIDTVGSFEILASSIAETTGGKIMMPERFLTNIHIPRSCKVCGKSLEGKRRDALTCSTECRVMKHKADIALKEAIFINGEGYEGAEDAEQI